MKSPAQFFRNDRPYESYEEYLSELSVWMTLKIKHYVQSNIVGLASEESQERKYKESSYETVLQKLDSILMKEGLTQKESLEEWEELIKDRLELNEFTNHFFAIDYVVDKMKLDELGKAVLVFSMMTSLDTTYRSVFASLNQDEKKQYPTLELCGRICKKAEQTRFDMYHQIYNQVRSYRILFPGINAANEYMDQELICDERLLDILLGKNRCIPSEIDILEDEPKDPLWFRENESNELESFVEDKNFPIFMLCGERGIGKKQLVQHFVQKHNMKIVYFDGCAYERSGESGYEKLTEALQYAVRECVLWTMPLMIQGIDGFESNLKERLLTHLKEELLEVIQLIFVLINEEKYVPETTGIYVLPLKAYDEIQRIAFWNYYKSGYQLEEDIHIEEIANTFSLTPGKMKTALYQASISAGGLKKTISKKILYRSCYEQLHHRLGEKTEKVIPGFEWDDLKMAPAEKEVLADICHCVKNRHTVMSQWNFAKVVPYGAGITVLFSGPPGTGKTMAAQVIANELQMELYKIDLSQIVDKYVGETEKNIKMIFDEAQKSNSILFFDEADAIFNKRLEASNANERFANMESSLLLQCVEAYQGISILATNHFNAIDSAFIRRFKYHILFREPDEATRYEIWCSVFPKEAPLDEEVDLHLLAHLFDFTGAIIKNIALAAAYLAAERTASIAYIDILKATKREMQKANLILTKEKLGNLGYLYQEII